MVCQQLIQEERTMIYAFCKVEYYISQIASEQGRHKSIICREIKRNTGKRGYRLKQVHEKDSERKYCFAVIEKVEENTRNKLK